MKFLCQFTPLGVVLLAVFGCSMASFGTRRGEPADVISCPRPPIVVRELLSIRTITPSITNEVTVRVDSNGMVNTQDFGKVRAAGKFESELATELSGRITNRFSSYRVVVTLMDSYVTVSGAVKTPARIVLDERLKATEAISMAGGFKDNVSSFQKRRIKIRRDRGVVVKLDYLKALEDPQFDVELYFRDWIIVPD